MRSKMETATNCRKLEVTTIVNIKNKIKGKYKKKYLGKRYDRVLNSKYTQTQNLYIGNETRNSTPNSNLK